MKAIHVKILFIILITSLVVYKITYQPPPFQIAPTGTLQQDARGRAFPSHPKQRRRIETSGLLVGRGPMLISEESDSGIVTNTYYLSPSNIIVQVTQPTPVDKWFGTSEYENLAKADFEKNFSLEQQLTEIREILEDFSAAKNSDLLYTGIREVYACRAQIRELRKKRFVINEQISQLLFIADNSQDESAQRDARTKATELLQNSHPMIPLDLNDCRERTRQRLLQLYGEIPKPIFQRLMSIEPTTTPQPLQSP